MGTRVLVLVSADSEWRAVEELLQPKKLELTPLGGFFTTVVGPEKVTFFHGGWGKISAAATAQYALDRFRPALLVNLGTCGGFEGRIERGTVILVTTTIVYDILEQMSDPQQALEHYTTKLDLSWLSAPYPHPVLAGLLVSGDRDLLPSDIPMLVERYGGVAADWESGAIAWVARMNRVRCLILRGVTDLVGAGGGEAYGNIGLFHENTKVMMKRLIEQLPDWLGRMNYGLMGGPPCRRIPSDP